MAEVNLTMGTLTVATKASIPIETWAMSNYERSCGVFENCDPRHAPGEKDCPLVIFYVLQKATGLSNRKKTMSIGVTCWVFDSEKPESVEGVVRYLGGRLVVELQELVLDEVIEHMPAGLKLQDVDTDYGVLEDFPLVSADMALTITEEKLIGVNPYK